MEPPEGENTENPSALQSAEKKALHPIDYGTDIGAMSVTELAERWDTNTNKHKK
jgi:hypothetical protein